MRARVWARAMRVHQWVKNLIVLAPLVFSHGLLDGAMVLRAVGAFFLFCAMSSAVYLLNDMADVEKDRAHPVKKMRPLASGELSVRTARRMFFFLAAGAAVLAVWIGVGFGWLLMAYLVLNVLYSSWLKRIAYLDVLCIAAGFELRVLGGASAARVQPSGYLVVVMFFLALFLGFGKRLHELRQLSDRGSSRASLLGYSDKILRWILVLTGFVTVVTYFVYTLDAHTQLMFGTPYLAVTTVFTAYGLFRFLQLVRGRADAESPTEQMLRDPIFLANLVVWVVAVIAVIYFF